MRNWPRAHFSDFGQGQLGTLILIAVGLWFLTHPYVGFDYHDTRIYTILALHWLQPEAFASDPFFLFGSQDNLSLFSPLYGSLIQWFGIDVAGQIILLIGMAVWVLAALLLSASLVHWPLPRAAAVLAMSVLVQNYSPNGDTFAINESFATARSWAFPLGALALGMLLQSRVWAATVMALVSCVLHPLLGIWILGFGILWLLHIRLSILLVTVSAISLSALALFQMGPFEWFTPEWAEFVRLYARDVMVGSGPGPRYNAIALHLSLLLLAGRLELNPELRRFYFTALIVSAGGIFAATICSYWLPAKLLIQAQLWRSMWVAVLLSPFAAATVLFRLWNSRQDYESALQWQDCLMPWVTLIGLTLLLAFPDWSGGLLMSVAIANVIVAGRATSVAELMSPYLPYLRSVSVLLILIALPAYFVEQQIAANSIDWFYIEGLSPILIFLVKGGGGPGFLLVAWAILRCTSRLQLILMLLWCTSMAMLWDVRAETELLWERQVSIGDRGELGQYIKQGEVVLWAQRMPIRAWFELRTAHYASPTQSVGFVFSTDKADELLRRRDRIRRAYEYEQQLGYDATHHHVGREEYEAVFSFNTPRSPEGIRVLCEDPALDWVVVSPEAYGAVAPAILAYDSLLEKMVAAYPCARMR